MTQFPFLITSTLAVFSKDDTQIYASLHSANSTICTGCSLTELPSSLQPFLNPG